MKLSSELWTWCCTNSNVIVALLMFPGSKCIPSTNIHLPIVSKSRRDALQLHICIFHAFWYLTVLSVHCSLHYVVASFQPKWLPLIPPVCSVLIWQMKVPEILECHRFVSMLKHERFELQGSDWFMTMRRNTFLVRKWSIDNRMSMLMVSLSQVQVSCKLFTWKLCWIGWIRCCSLLCDSCYFNLLQLFRKLHEKVECPVSWYVSVLLGRRLK
jgi:hypothetical protein